MPYPHIPQPSTRRFFRELKNHDFRVRPPKRRRSKSICLPQERSVFIQRRGIAKNPPCLSWSPQIANPPFRQKTVPINKGACDPGESVCKTTNYGQNTHFFRRLVMFLCTPDVRKARARRLFTAFLWPKNALLVCGVLTFMRGSPNQNQPENAPDGFRWTLRSRTDST